VKRNVLLDTGPLVAYLNGRDWHHDWVVMRLADIAPPLLTCESVLSETCFILRKFPAAQQAALELLARGLLAIPFRLEAELAPVQKLLKRYADLPMSLADACLVRMAEQISDSVLLTLDRDFRIYRKHGRQVIPVIMPDQGPA
jgi:predicted nucleic acid-binding protein